MNIKLLLNQSKLTNVPKVFLEPIARRFSNQTYMEEKIQVGDYKINYLKVGNGPNNLLLMPGGLGSVWTDFGPQVKGLDKKIFTIVAWDPPGYGKSIPPKREYPIDFFEKDADTALSLMKILNLQKFSLLGWSNGGISSLILAAKYPKCVEKIVIWGSNSHILPTEIIKYKDFTDINKWSKSMKDPLLALYGEIYFIKSWSKWYETMKNIYYQNGGDICTSYLRKIKCPAFILHGEKDSWINPHHTQILLNSIENSRLHVYPEGKHNVHLKYAEDFNRRVTEFLVSHTNN